MRTESAMRPATHEATVVKKPKTFWTRTRAECMAARASWKGDGGEEMVVCGMSDLRLESRGLFEVSSGPCPASINKVTRYFSTQPPRNLPDMEILVISFS